MRITECRVTKLYTGSAILGLGTVTFDDIFVVSGIKILEGRNGLFISFPSYETKNGEYKDICFPIDGGFREELQEVVLEEFEKAPNPSANRGRGSRNSGSSARSSQGKYSGRTGGRSGGTRGGRR